MKILENRNTFLKLFLSLLLLTPVFALAASTPQNFSQLVDLLLSMMNTIVSILGSIAVIIFIWGIIKYISSAGDEGHRQGRQLMLWGIVALFVMVSVFGLARIAISVFLGNTTTTTTR